MSKAKEELYKFHQELNAPQLTPREVMQMGLTRVAGLLRADCLTSFLWDEPRRVLSLALSYSRGRLLQTEQKIHLTQSHPLWQVVEGGRSSLAFRDPHQILYTPLRWRGSEKPQGVLRLERYGKRPFNTLDKKLALEFSQELAQNLQSAEQLLRNRMQLKRLSTLTELTAVFASSLRVQDSLRLILQGIQQHFGFDRVRLYVVDKTGSKLRGEMGVDIRGRVQNLRSDEIPLQPGAHRFANVLLASTPDASIERYRDVVLYLPLIVQAQRIGLLILDNLTSQQPIAREDAALLKSFAGQIALAVDNARLFDEVQELSLYDSLTQLPLRRYFNQRVQEEMYRAERFSQPLSLVLIDIDFFKDINDRYGHQIGDLTLVEVSKVILSQLRKIDFPCRFGGDEILILLPQAKEEEAKMITSRLLQAIQKVRVPVPFAKQGEVGVTVSMGVATYPADSKTIEGLIEKADEALYWVKSHGRNGVAAFQGLGERSAQPGLFSGDPAVHIEKEPESGTAS